MSGYDPAQLAELLRSLELRIDRKLDGLLHGQHLGLTPGHGSEPGEARPYLAGDDVRRMDWNVTARTRELHVRELVADRDLEAWLAVDLSPTMAFGTALSEKRDVALGAAAAVGFLTARSQNRVGAVIATAPRADGSPAVRALPPRSGRDHLRAVLTVIAGIEIEDGGGRADLGALVADVAGRSRRRGFTCVISDFLAPPETWRRQIGAHSMRHDVLAIEIVDPRELDLPAIGAVTLRDPATGRVRDVRLTAAVRQRYAAAASNRREEIRRSLLAAGVHHLQLRTDHDWLTALVGHVERRRRQPGALRRGVAVRG